ncbi:MAG: long-chain fatty acid--CoA ligase [Acidobacteriota bacterium]
MLHSEGAGDRLAGDLLGERARLTPDAEALVVVDTGARLSYRELDQRAVRCALAWRGLGLEPDDRVAILAHNRVEYVEAFFAAPKAGIVLVTLGTRLTARELAEILADAGALAVLYDGALGEVVDELRNLEDGPAVVEHWIALDAPRAADDLPYAELVAAVEPSGFEPTPRALDDLHCLLYTSGTTGTPKGVMIPHRQVIWNGYNTACGWQLRADDVSPIFTPLYHAGGLMAFLVPIVTIGGRIVLHGGFDAAEVWRTIEAEGCTVVLGVPTIWKMLMEAPEFPEVDLSRVRWLISGGAPLPEYIAEAYRARGVEFLQGFGMTEVGVNCFAMTVDDSRRKPGSIGKPMMFTEVRLVDDDGADVAVGQVGEMLFRGPHVSRGYWNRPEATAEALDADGWFHSGDAARRDEDGFVYVAGRTKDMIISGGVNIYPAEIEAQLLRHSAVQDAAVVGVPDEQWGEVGVAFVVARAEVTDGAGALDESVLVEHLQGRLARYKVPKIYRWRDELPRTAYGKVVKGILRDEYLAEGGAS